MWFHEKLFMHSTAFQVSSKSLPNNYYCVKGQKSGDGYNSYVFTVESCRKMNNRCFKHQISYRKFPLILVDTMLVVKHTDFSLDIRCQSATTSAMLPKHWKSNRQQVQNTHKKYKYSPTNLASTCQCYCWWLTLCHCWIRCCCFDNLWFEAAATHVSSY